MSEHEGLTNPEIADAPGISLHAVKIRLHRARRRLQTLIPVYTVDNPKEVMAFFCISKGYGCMHRGERY